VDCTGQESVVWSVEGGSRKSSEGSAFGNTLLISFISFVWRTTKCRTEENVVLLSLQRTFSEFGEFHSLKSWHLITMTSTLFRKHYFSKVCWSHSPCLMLINDCLIIAFLVTNTIIIMIITHKPHTHYLNYCRML